MFCCLVEDIALPKALSRALNLFAQTSLTGKFVNIAYLSESYGFYTKRSQSKVKNSRNVGKNACNNGAVVQHRGLPALVQLCPNRGPWAACGPGEGFVRPSLDFHCSTSNYILTTCPYFDNLKFEIFDVGCPQCHFIMSVTIAVRIRTLSVH